MVQVPSSSGTAAPTMRASPALSSTASQTTTGRGKSTISGNGYHPAQPTVHLSAMQSAPLDLLSVERRGQPTASRETVKKIRPHGLQEAPTYRPSEEEFKDPFAYIKKISPEASKYGMCKIIPPESWNPDFAIDTEHFHFRTRKQELNSVEGSTRANLTYLDQLQKFHKQNGTNLNRFPSVDKRPLDLYKLRKAVEARGGFEKVCKLKKWAEIGRDLGYSGKIMSSLSTSLKNSYHRWLYPFEEYLRLAKPGVHQQLEFEYGGPLTPSPANSPIKRSSQNTPASVRGDSPAVRASEALNASLKDTERSTPSRDSPLHSAPSGFTAVNSGGGFTAVNSSFTAVNNGRRDRDAERSSTPRRSLDTPMSSAKNTPEYRPSALGGTPLTNCDSTPNPLKRRLSHDSIDSRKEGSVMHDDEGENERRTSKRLKKDAVPTVAGSHMTFFKPSTPRVPRDVDSPASDVCENCGKADDLASILICESCDHAYHMHCLDPPVTTKPDYDWNCPRCLVGDGQFGFEEGGIYSLKQFQEKAGEFKEKYFENKMPFDPVFNCPRPVTEDDIEREFWRLVSSLEETVEVEYGADIHSTTHGSGFPTLEKCPKDPYATDPWNLNIMPLHADSLFRHIKSDISGMTVPWLYVGMIFSTFCWHNEDHYSYSANYQHFGSTKTWYGIPGEDAEKFEAAMRDAVPELFETQPDLLFQLVTLLPPEQLQKAGVRVYALDQRAGQFVITFPQAYHAGFNHGFNFNEAVNFAPSDWEPFGDMSIERLQQFRKQPCFSHDELLWTAAEGAATGGVTIATAKWLAPALERMRDREFAQRKAFLAKHNTNEHQCRMTGDKEKSTGCEIDFVIDEEDCPEDENVCVYCKAYSYLSWFKCQRSDKVLCLQHAGTHECCTASEQQRFSGRDHVMHFRRTDEEIVAMYQKVADKAHLPEIWEEKVEKALQEEATPQLKVLRNLINEGEKIPFELPSLQNLRNFVERCNEWVDEATNYIVRKQQNRRKEKAWRKGSKSAEMEERERELRKVENVLKLLKEAEQLGFDCPEINQLQDRADAITTFQNEARAALTDKTKTTAEFEEMLDVGRTYNVDMPELDQIEKLVQQMKWIDHAKLNRGVLLTFDDVKALLEDAARLEISQYNEHFIHYRKQKEQAEAWEVKAKELMSAENVNLSQLETLSDQATYAALPVSAETVAAVDQILNKQREAHKQVVSLLERCRTAGPDNRPKYSEVRELMEQISELNSKPGGTVDLEKEQKRHEDWMRKGKKLFGKANAPLHILKSHMEYVLERNLDCFEIRHDKPRLPAEPASREPTPTDQKMHSWEDPRFREVFCICRRVEAGMMIECELCHEWYHGKCLKIARGKVKEDEKYTCPICDWRVKIPRDAARPKLEDLQAWQEEVPGLPFQPDEEQLLEKIITNAQDFRNHVMPFCNPLMTTSEEAETQRFYLRKIEGAEILLAYETNYFRQELHKWSPVAPEPPPVLEVSKSTRKPRPTKTQKLMAQYGVNSEQELPPALRTKQHHFKRKSTDNTTSRPQLLQPALGRSASGTPTSHAFPTLGPLPMPNAGPALPGGPDAPPQHHPNFTYNDSYGMPGSHHSTPSIFTPLALQRPGVMSPTFGASVSPRTALGDSTPFNNTPSHNRNGHGGVLESPGRDGYNSAPLNSQPAASLDKMFRDVTNLDEESSQPTDSQGKEAQQSGSKSENPGDRPPTSGSTKSKPVDSPTAGEKSTTEKHGPWETDHIVLFDEN